MSFSDGKIPSFPPALVLQLLQSSLPVSPSTGETDERYDITDTGLLLTCDLLSAFVRDVIKRCIILAENEAMIDSEDDDDDDDIDDESFDSSSNKKKRRKVKTIEIKPSHIQSVAAEVIMDYS
ncbi:hypothetical protein TrST_g13666 [Triparma strigata]|uniref:Uncharacterized protein n=1 Tax=Triparma strigata TaxID=1606541 RepID=A0A9W7BDS8_9STRA|nr:hypothetical protein TrST_g13666 [Triparma strigata]